MDFREIIPWLISGGSFAVALFALLRNKRKDAEGDIEANQEFRVKVNMKLDQICNTTTDIKTDIKSIQQKQNEHSEQIAVLKRDLETAFMRIDELRENLRNINN